LILQVVLGVTAVLYGLTTAWCRSFQPARLGKLDGMCKRMGPRAGYVVHVLGYSVIPVAVGVGLVATAL
jgi:hypothetical protein